MSDFRKRCSACRDGEPLAFAFTMAFHPIVDVEQNAAWGYEALVRGTEGQSAGHILSQVDDSSVYRFDQACRVKAIEMAGRLFPGDGPERLSINFMPNAVYEPSACIRTTLETASRVGFRADRLMFEFTENERMDDLSHVERIIAAYKRLGFTTAIDDFGAGHSGLNLLANFQPDLIKLDMDLIRNADTSAARRAIISGILLMARQLDVAVVAEGVETEAELRTLKEAGIRLFQGYLFARPAVAALPAISIPL